MLLSGSLGLLRLEELVRHFLISRETLSVRMLDDSLDPTPLLKEIRDDKVATIIIEANASISYHILRKVSNFFFVTSPLLFLLLPFLKLALCYLSSDSVAVQVIVVIYGEHCIAKCVKMLIWKQINLHY